jgi:hypothetical protein
MPKINRICKKPGILFSMMLKISFFNAMNSQPNKKSNDAEKINEIPAVDLTTVD